jgi:hypothetical protein
MALGNYDEAAKWAVQALVHRPSYMPAIWLVSAANALLGNLNEARSFMPKIRFGNPEMRQANLANYIPNRRPEVVRTFVEGLRLAGLPE